MQLSKGGLVPGSAGYNDHPTISDKIHCVVLVMNATTVTSMDDVVKDKIKDIRTEADARCKISLANFT